MVYSCIRADDEDDPPCATRSITRHQGQPTEGFDDTEALPHDPSPYSPTIEPTWPCH